MDDVDALVAVLAAVRAQREEGAEGATSVPTGRAIATWDAMPLAACAARSYVSTLLLTVREGGV